MNIFSTVAFKFMCQHINRTTKKMLFVSFIIFIVLSVTTVQPIYCVDNVTNTQNVKGHANEQKDVVFSEGASYHVNSDTKQSVSTHKVSDNLVKMLTQKKLNATEQSKIIDQPIASGAKHRNVNKVDNPPLDSDEQDTNNNNNNPLANDNKTAVTAFNHTITDVSVTKNTTAKISKVEQTPIVAPTQNNVTKVIPKPPLDGSTMSKTTNMTTKIISNATTSASNSTTTTIQLPKKPLVTFSVEDVPGLLTKAAETPPQAPIQEIPVEEVRENEPQLLQLSEIKYSEEKSNHNFIMSIVGILVAIPFIVLVVNCAVRRARDYWSKRRYRRMDYLIEDMYN